MWGNFDAYVNSLSAGRFRLWVAASFTWGYLVASLALSPWDWVLEFAIDAALLCAAFLLGRRWERS